MKASVKILATLTFLSFVGLSFTEPVTDADLYRNYVAAIRNKSTIQSYLVVSVTDLNRGTTREYCTKGNFLVGAVYREYQLDKKNGMEGLFMADSIVISHKDRTFQFTNPSAVENIDYHYSINDLHRLEATTNFDSIANLVKYHDGVYIFDDKKLAMYAHILFLRGIPTCENNCYGGKLMPVPHL